MPAKIRKIIVQTDEIRVEMGRDIQPPVRKALAMAVIENPCAGRYVDNLDELIAIGEELGALLGARCVQALGIAPGEAHSYGKAAIVGEAGELERPVRAAAAHLALKFGRHRAVRFVDAPDERLKLAVAADPAASFATEVETNPFF